MSLKNDWNFTQNKLPLWSKLEVLYHIVKAGSLVRAAKVLKTDQPTLSSKLATLEKKFGFKLINRSTPHKPLSLTRKGEEVFRVAEQTYMLTREMNTRLYDNDTLKGKVRLSTTHAISSYIVTPFLIEFSSQNPDTSVEILCNDSDLNTYNQDIDILICPYVEDDENLIQEHLFTFQVGLYASQEYLDIFGKPETVNDLDHHRLLTFAQPDKSPYSDVNWALKIGRQGKKNRTPFHTANSTEILLKLAEAGLGITPFCDFMGVGRGPKLVRVLEELNGPPNEFFLTYPKNLVNSRRIILIKDFLLKKARNFRRSV